MDVHEIVVRPSRKKGIIISLSVLTLLFIIWLYFADIIIIHILKGNTENVVYTAEIPIAKPLIGYSIDDINISSEDIKSITNISGWGLLKNNLKKDRKVRLYLSSEKTTYAIDCFNFPRGDTVSIQKAVNGMAIIEDNNVGFAVDFTPIPIKDGIYRLGLYIKEGTGQKGLSWSDNYFVKQKGMFYKLEDKSKIIEMTYRQVENFDGNLVSNEVIGNIESTKRDINDNDYYQISGWVCFKDKDSFDQIKYVQIKSNSNENHIITFTADTIARPDVVKYYKNDKYYFSGFELYVPVDKFQKGNSTVTVIVVNQDGKEAALDKTALLSSE